MAARHVGLDIGRSFIKAIEVTTSGAKKELTGASTIATPPGGIQSESDQDLARLSDAIKAVFEKANIDSDKCSVSLVESQVVSRLIQMPALTDKELAAAIHWEAEQYIPLPMKDVYLQHKVVFRPEATQAGAKMDVLLVAAPNRLIEKYLKVLKAAGLRPEALETESFALTRAVTRPGDPATVIVSMGAASTEIIIASAGNVIFTRSVATGGLSLTKAIMAAFNLPASQAEEYKQTYGILEDKLSGKVASVLKPILDIVTSEVLKAVEFAKVHVQQAVISRIIICGGGAFMPGLSEFLAQRTNLEVSPGDPWFDFVKEGLILKLPGQGAIYTVATGLALHSG